MFAALLRLALAGELLARLRAALRAVPNARAAAWRAVCWGFLLCVALRSALAARLHEGCRRCSEQPSELLQCDIWSLAARIQGRCR